MSSILKMTILNFSDQQDVIEELLGTSTDDLVEEITSATGFCL